MYITIKSLWKRHKNKSMIARLTGHDWKTVIKRIKKIEEGKEYLAKKPPPQDIRSLTRTDYEMVRRRPIRDKNA